MNRTHNMTRTPEYQAWRSMRARCWRTTRKDYERWGGRGITVCDRWSKSFENFFADMGPKPSPKHSLDRIDNNGNYEPGNCRWATCVEQNNNQRWQSSCRRGHPWTAETEMKNGSGRTCRICRNARRARAALAHTTHQPHPTPARR